MLAYVFFPQLTDHISRPPLVENYATRLGQGVIPHEAFHGPVNDLQPLETEIGHKHQLLGFARFVRK